MKKTISIAFAAMLCVSGAFADTTDRSMTIVQIDEKENIQLGSENIARIRKDYETGRYQDFLREMDHIFDEAIDKEYILGLGKLRRGVVDLNNWFEGVNKIKDETHFALNQAVAGLETRFASKVRNVAKEDKLENLFVPYHQMQPGTGKNADENRLITLDLEYEYKSIHLDQSKIDLPKDMSPKELHYVLKMEQMDKILLASQTFDDADLKASIEQFGQNLDARLAKHWDLMDLRNLNSADPIEIRVSAILKNHSDKIQEFTREYLASNR
jgi:hypothetical protein